MRSDARHWNVAEKWVATLLVAATGTLGVLAVLAGW